MNDMETKMIVSWLYDKAARAQDHSYARMLNMTAKRLRELDPTVEAGGNSTPTVEVIKYPTEADWMLVKKCTLVTVGKETNTPPTEKFKKDLLKSRHSPIRELKFVFYLKDIPYWVSVHLCRHIHAQPYVKTQRNDRQSSYDRNNAPQNVPVDMMWSMNAEELITIANKRLCNLASGETRELVQMICKEVTKLCPEFKDELVPMCVRNGGTCYEIFPCGRRGENG